MQERLALSLVFALFFSLVAESADLPFRIRLTSVPRTLDWNIATTGSENAVLQNLMRTLFTFDTESNLLPDLAESYHWLEDQKTLEITLKTERWNDGTPLNAHHFLDSFERVLNPALNSKNAALLFDVEGAREYFLGKEKRFSNVGIRAKDSRTLRFQLKEPRANFPILLTHLATAPYRKDRPSTTIGPYELKARSPHSIVLKARAAKPEIKTVEFIPIRDGKDALQRYRQGKLDYLLQLEDQWVTPEAMTAQTVRVVALIHLNPTRVNTNTPEKRRAIMRAIGTQQLIAGHARTRESAKSLIPPGLLGSETRSTDDFSIAELPQDPLFLGYPPDEYSRALAEQIRKVSHELKIKIEALPQGEPSSHARNYDLLITLFGFDVPDADQLLSSFLAQGTHDLFNASPPELLKWIQKAHSTASVKERAEAYRSAVELLQSRTAFVMPLFYRKRACLLSQRYRFEPGRVGSPKLSFIHLRK